MIVVRANVVLIETINVRESRCYLTAVLVIGYLSIPASSFLDLDFGTVQYGTLALGMIPWMFMDVLCTAGR